MRHYGNVMTKTMSQYSDDVSSVTHAGCICAPVNAITTCIYSTSSTVQSQTELVIFFSLVQVVTVTMIQERDSGTRNFGMETDKKHYQKLLQTVLLTEEEDEAEFEGKSFQCDVLRFRIKVMPYSLTPWSRVFLEKLTGFHLVKKFTAFYGTRWLIIAFTSARIMSLS